MIPFQLQTGKLALVDHVPSISEALELSNLLPDFPLVEGIVHQIPPISQLCQSHSLYCPWGPFPSGNRSWSNYYTRLSASNLIPPMEKPLASLSHLQHTLSVLEFLSGAITVSTASGTSTSSSSERRRLATRSPGVSISYFTVHTCGSDAETQ